MSAVKLSDGHPVKDWVCEVHGYTGWRGDACPLCPEATFTRDAPIERALATQVGGDHYKKLKIQPMEYSMANDLNACQHTIIKYVTRYKDKGGIDDLKKARHTIDMLIELEGKE